MLENIFVFSMMCLSGGYILRRLHRQSLAVQQKQSACGSCASASCATQPAQQTGETGLRMHTQL